VLKEGAYLVVNRKVPRKIRIISTILLIMMFLQSFPSKALAYDVKGRLSQLKNKVETKLDFLQTPINIKKLQTQNKNKPLQAPTNLGAVRGTTNIKLSWKNPKTNQNVVGYEITYQNLENGEIYRQNSPGTATKCTVSGLLAGTEYSFTVKVKDSSGKLSSASKAMKLETAGIKGVTNTQEFSRVKSEKQAQEFQKAKITMLTFLDKRLNPVKAKTKDSNYGTKLTVGGGEGFSKEIAKGVVDTFEFACQINPITNGQKIKDLGISSVQKIGNKGITILQKPRETVIQPAMGAGKSIFNAVKNPRQTSAQIAQTTVNTAKTTGGVLAGLGYYGYTGAKNLLKDPHKTGMTVGAAAGFLVLGKGPKDVRKIDLALKGNKISKISLGTVNNGKAKLNGKAVVIEQKAFNTFSESQLRFKNYEFEQIQKQLASIDENILNLYKKRKITKSEAKSCLRIVDEACVQTEVGTRLVNKELREIEKVKKFANLDFAKKYSLNELKYLKNDIISEIKHLKALQASKGLRQSYSYLLGKIMKAQAEEKIRTIKKPVIPSYYDDLFSREARDNLGNRYSLNELKHLQSELKLDFRDRKRKEPESFLFDSSLLKIDVSAAKISLLKADEYRIGRKITRDLLKKESLLEQFTPIELTGLAKQIKSDSRYIQFMGNAREKIEIKKLLGKVRIAEKSAAEISTMEAFLAESKLGIKSLQKLQDYKRIGTDFLKVLQREEQEVFIKNSLNKISPKDATNLLAKNYAQEDRIKAQLNLIQKQIDLKRKRK